MQLKASHAFTDAFGKQRKAGEEWLVTLQDTECYIPDVNETIVAKKDLVSLTNRQWCIILNPVNEAGEPQMGHRKLVRGEANFFLQPQEVIEKQQYTQVLGVEEALEVRCLEAFDDTSGGRTTKRGPGEEWLIYGPCEYVPPLEVEVKSFRTRKALIQLDSLGLYALYWK